MAKQVKIWLALTFFVGLFTACNNNMVPESVPDITPEPTEEMVVKPESISQDTFALDELFSLGGGETAVLDTGDLQIHFTEVPEDSRCPTEVNCFWSGRALVVITAQQGRESVLLEFDTNPAPGETADSLPAFDYMVQLEQLDPYPKNPENPIIFTDYRAQLVVERP
jgi:hypothetical protein